MEVIRSDFDSSIDEYNIVMSHNNKEIWVWIDLKDMLKLSNDDFIYICTKMVNDTSYLNDDDYRMSESILTLRDMYIHVNWCFDENLHLDKIEIFNSNDFDFFRLISKYEDDNNWFGIN